METNIDHDYLIYKGFKPIVDRFRICFEHNIVCPYYVKEDDLYCFFFQGEQYSFVELIEELRREYGVDVSIESYKIFKRSNTIKQILNDHN